MAKNPLSWMPTAEIATFARELRHLGGFNVALCHSLVNWADFPGKKGLFTAVMAKNTITRILNNIDTGLPTWESESLYYTAWKKKHNLGKGFWNLSGAVQDSLIVRNTSNGADVGLDARRRVPTMRYGNVNEGPARGRSLKVEEYAAWMEYGTKYMNPRALFAPSFLQVVQQDLPNMERIVRTAMRRSVKIHGREKITGRKGGVNVTLREGGVGGEFSSKSATSSNTEAMTTYEQEQANSREIAIACKTGKIHVIDTDITTQEKKEIKADIKQGLVELKNKEQVATAKKAVSDELRKELLEMGYKDGDW